MEALLSDLALLLEGWAPCRPMLASAVPVVNSRPDTRPNVTAVPCLMLPAGGAAAGGSSALVLRSPSAANGTSVACPTSTLRPGPASVAMACTAQPGGQPAARDRKRRRAPVAVNAQPLRLSEEQAERGAFKTPPFAPLRHAARQGRGVWDLSLWRNVAATTGVPREFQENVSAIRTMLTKPEVVPMYRALAASGSAFAIKCLWGYDCECCQ